MRSAILLPKIDVGGEQMNYYDSISDLLLDLRADLEEIGDEMIWAYYKDEKLVDYRYKNSPDESTPKGYNGEVIKEILASELYQGLR